MATVSSVAKLYAGVAQLAYTVSQMAATPLLPFVAADVPRLLTQSNTLAGQAVAIHGRTPAPMLQPAVDSATSHVLAAQQLFGIINSSPTNSLTSAAVFATTDAAIAAVTAV